MVELINISVHDVQECYEESYALASFVALW